MPIIKVKTKEELPAELHEHLKEAADKSGFEINVSPTAKLDEFRQNNINVSKERDELKDRWGKVAPVIGEKPVEDFLKELGELQALQQKVKDGKVQGTEAIEAEITKRTETMRATLESQIAAKGTELGTWKAKAEAAEAVLKQYKVDSAVNALVGDKDIGLNPKALNDVMARARAVFEVQADGSLIPKRNGEVLRGENGVDPMTVAEWMKNLRKEAEYFFLGSNGGGASGDAGGGGQAKFGGYTEAQFNGLSPLERLKIANRVGSK